MTCPFTNSHQQTQKSFGALWGTLRRFKVLQSAQSAQSAKSFTNGFADECLRCPNAPCLRITLGEHPELGVDERSGSDRVSKSFLHRDRDVYGWGCGICDARIVGSLITRGLGEAGFLWRQLKLGVQKFGLGGDLDVSGNPSWSGPRLSWEDADTGRNCGTRRTVPSSILAFEVPLA